MIFLKEKYKPKKNIIKEEVNVNISTKTTEEKIEELNTLNDVIKTSKKTEVKKLLKKEISKGTVGGFKDFFDEEMIKDLDTLYNFFKSFVPNLKEYYSTDENGQIDISMRAYIDARDLLLNEFKITKEDILYNTDDSGLTNTTKKYFSGNISIDKSGIIRKLDEILINPNELESLSVSKISKDTTVLNDVFTISNKRLDENLLSNLTEEECDYITFKKNNGEDVNLKDILPFTNKTEDEVIDELKELISSIESKETGTQMCNTKDINYLQLTLLLILGGGESTTSKKKSMPLPTVFDEVSGKNKCGLVLSYNKSPCSSKKFNTWHPKIYYEKDYTSNGIKVTKNKTGIKKSLLQLFYQALDNLGIFNLNIPKIEVSFKVLNEKIKLKIFPGLCIGGAVSSGLCSIQEVISKEIRNMIGCDVRYFFPSINSDGEGLTSDSSYIDNERLVFFMNFSKVINSLIEISLDSDDVSITNSELIFYTAYILNKFYGYKVEDVSFLKYMYSNNYHKTFSENLEIDFSESTFNYAEIKDTSTSTVDLILNYGLQEENKCDIDKKIKKITKEEVKVFLYENLLLEKTDENGESYREEIEQSSLLSETLTSYDIDVLTNGGIEVIVLSDYEYITLSNLTNIYSSLSD